VTVFSSPLRRFSASKPHPSLHIHSPTFRPFSTQHAFEIAFALRNVRIDLPRCNAPGQNPQYFLRWLCSASHLDRGLRHELSRQQYVRVTSPAFFLLLNPSPQSLSAATIRRSRLYLTLHRPTRSLIRIVSHSPTKPRRELA